MTVTVILTITKPSNVQFFADSDPLFNSAIRTAAENWNLSQPGLISSSRNRVDQDTTVATYVFDTMDNYVRWRITRKEFRDHAARSDYNSRNGINTSYEEIVTND